MRKALNTWCVSHNSDKSKKRSRSPAEPRRRRKRTHAMGVHPLPPAVLSVTISLAAQDCAVARGGKAPVSACKPLCAIFLRKPRVYPLSSVKANVGHLCEKLKSAMRSGLKQRCGGNFLAIVAGTILSEKLNFTGGFFEWRRPFDFSTRYLITPVTADALKKTMEDAEQWDRSF